MVGRSEDGSVVGAPGGSEVQSGGCGMLDPRSGDSSSRGVLSLGATAGGFFFEAGSCSSPGCRRLADRRFDARVAVEGKVRVGERDGLADRSGLEEMPVERGPQGRTSPSASASLRLEVVVRERPTELCPA
jgi:hypothetical protein